MICVPRNTEFLLRTSGGMAPTGGI